MLEVDCSTNALVWGKCLRARVLINVAKPLMRGSIVNFKGSSSKVIFRYEKLGDFCFICGKLDHVDRDCLSIFANETGSIKGMK